MKALYRPDQTINGKDYWFGVLILMILGLAIQLSGGLLYPRFEPWVVAAVGGLLSYLLVYPWFCLIGARLADAGYPRWQFLVLLFLYLACVNIGGMVFLGPKMVPLLQLDDIPAAMAAVRELQEEYASPSHPANVVIYLISSFLVAFLAGKIKPKARGD